MGAIESISQRLGVNWTRGLSPLHCCCATSWTSRTTLGLLWEKFGKLLKKLWDSFERTFTHLLYTLFGLEISLHNCGATTWTFSLTGLTAHLDKRQQMVNFCTIPNVLSCFKITSVCPEFYFHFEVKVKFGLALPSV